MAYPEYKVATFGASYTGLHTVSYQTFQYNNVPYASSVTSGIVELGYGNYGALINFPDNFLGYVKWSAGVSGVLAFTPINYTDLTNYPSSVRFGSGDMVIPNIQVP